MDKKVKILDCTLRDGGYKNNWWFSDKDVHVIANAAHSNQISYVELGIIGGQAVGSGVFGRLNVDSFSRIVETFSIPSEKTTLLMNWSEVSLTANETLVSRINDFTNAGLGLLRITVREKNLTEIQLLLRGLAGSGLKTSVNVMQAHDVGGKLVGWLESKPSDAKVDFLYLADTFGCMFPDQVNSLISGLRNYTSIPLGFHAHDNRGLAIENTFAAIDAGVLICDATYGSMGRGAGNASLGKLVLDKRFSHGPLESVRKIIEAEDYFSGLQGTQAWGSNLVMRFAADNAIHPSMAETILDYETYSTLDKIDTLSKLSKLGIEIKSLEALDSLPFEKIFSEKPYVFSGLPNHLNGKALIKFGESGPQDQVLSYWQDYPFDLKVSLLPTDDEAFVYACASGFKAMRWKDKKNNVIAAKIMTFASVASFAELSENDVIVIDKHVAPPGSSRDRPTLPNLNSLTMSVMSLAASGIKEIYLFGVGAPGIDAELLIEMESGVDSAKLYWPDLKVYSLTKSLLSNLDMDPGFE